MTGRREEDGQGTSNSWMTAHGMGKILKNDFRDAEAIADAMLRPTMRFAPAKRVEQLELQALHRGWCAGARQWSISSAPSCWSAELRNLRQTLPDILAKLADVLTPRMTHMVEGLELTEVCKRKARWRTITPPHLCSMDLPGSSLS
jgi:hypothetical protein